MTTKAQMESLRRSIVALAEEHQPCTVRQIYYLGIGVLWDKDTGGKRTNYKRVVREVGILRETDRLPWGWIADNTRWVRQDTMYASPEDALDRWGEAYRRDLWASQPRHVEVWCESDSIAGVLDRVTRPLGVGLFVCRGQSSKTYVYEAAQAYRRIGKPVSILYVGDWDPSGLAIPLSVEGRMRRYGSGEISIELVRVAVTPEDVRGGELVVKHQVNRKDSNHRRFAEHCELMGLDPQIAVEVEALPPEELRDRLANALLGLVDDPASWEATLAAEHSEREVFRRMSVR
jgi:hypothetical protein